MNFNCGGKNNFISHASYRFPNFERLISFVVVTALILEFDDSTLSQRLLINVLLKSCISVLFIILVELVSMWLGSLFKDSPKFN